jgi:hypothetical protein
MSAGDASRLQLEAIAGKATGFLLAMDERIVFGRQNEGPGRLADARLEDGRWTAAASA